ncbi:MAG: hypothetical protein KIY12_05765 [Thermoplasmata archaeon]|uniref:Uncharacterized protein n=1 Tax=Candidatus Sysuiplasma superficiale TaxID=2823368 RepID=A0A8J8CHR7_9ARCH|nr:hypothetical protein [Candidatus Sysuiplasma superficiale]MBX8644213.1 hypothetical protein [Candidatus Sysuiplasma superficiale]
MAQKRKVWLIADFRIPLIREGIEQADGINRLARIIGYRSRIHPAWPLRQILIGRQPFPIDRLEKLAYFLHYTLDEILRYEVSSQRLANEHNDRALKSNGFFSYSV